MVCEEKIIRSFLYLGLMHGQMIIIRVPVKVNATLIRREVTYKLTAVIRYQHFPAFVFRVTSYSTVQCHTLNLVDHNMNFRMIHGNTL